MHRWWTGELIMPDSDPDSGVFFVGGFHQRHWTARLAHKILGFLGREWKWVAGFAVAVAGLVIAAVR